MPTTHPKIVNDEEVFIHQSVKEQGEMDPVTELRPDIWMSARVNFSGGFHDPKGDIPTPTKHTVEQDCIDEVDAANAANGWTAAEITEVVDASKTLYGY